MSLHATKWDAQELWMDVELPWKSKGAGNPKVWVSIKRALCCVEGDITPSSSNSSLLESFKEYQPFNANFQDEIRI